jgi:hypothetical protein
LKARFEVSTEGMRALQSGREPWQLAKELVSNVWDEVATICEVTLTSISPRKARLTVRDDGSGFRDLKDAWTLMGHTPKRLNPTVRGRFNIGEKEILSVANDATIRTAGQIIRFPKTGGRRITKDKTPFQGTEIICTLPWGTRQVQTTIDKLKLLLVPNGLQYKVNGQSIYWNEPDQTIDATLDTILQDAPNEPMRHTRRRTTLDLYSANRGILYEMGIPIQPIDCPYLVNVMQKVPMPPNRDVVRDSYLQDIYTIVLNATADTLTDDNVSQLWVRTGIEDKEVQPEAVKTVMDKRYGDKVALWSSDSRANERAIEAGYELVHGKTLSPIERQTMQTVGLQHSSAIFPTNWGTAEPFPEEQWTSAMWNVVNYATRLADELLHINLRVSMYKMPNSSVGADFANGLLRFNVSNLGVHWFDTINPKVTSLLLHEFAHTDGEGHNWQYEKNLEELAGKAIHLALEKPNIFEGERSY